MKFLPSACCCLALGLVVAAHFTLNAQTPGTSLSEMAPAPRVYYEVQKERLSENWTDGDVFGLRAFAEPLVAEPIAASVEENAAFFAAINAFLLLGQAESLEGFLREWPGSRWAAALEHNLGLLKYLDGYFTAAMGYWKSAWDLAKDSKDPRLRALANQSLAELAGMQARLGRIEVLRLLLGILEEGEVGGSARQMLGTSADALHEMESRPDQSFKCGPFALAEVRKALGTPNALAPEIREIKSPYRGLPAAI